MLNENNINLKEKQNLYNIININFSQNSNNNPYEIATPSLLNNGQIFPSSHQQFILKTHNSKIVSILEINDSNYKGKKDNIPIQQIDKQTTKKKFPNSEIKLFKYNHSICKNLDNKQKKYNTVKQYHNISSNLRKKGMSFINFNKAFQAISNQKECSKKEKRFQSTHKNINPNFQKINSKEKNDQSYSQESRIKRK